MIEKKTMRVYFVTAEIWSRSYAGYTVKDIEEGVRACLEEFLVGKIIDIGMNATCYAEGAALTVYIVEAYPGAKTCAGKTVTEVWARLEEAGVVGEIDAIRRDDISDAEYAAAKESEAQGGDGLWSIYERIVWE